uniref:Guanylate cyclase domain-containing protein n=1 Tax=Dunaliella tertiolecta TaxID=3047 RepID=A0A7S3QMH0_DUNTE
MAQAWPKAVLKDIFRERRDWRGNLIFRGPRLKIGISQGRPDSIQPDHLGRADYHGDCVNSAARFMEGAAQGGMIVCEQDVAVKAAEAWAAMRTLELDPAVRENIVIDGERRRTPRPSSFAKLRKQHTSVDGRPRDASPSSPGTILPPWQGVGDRLTQRRLSLDQHSSSHSEPLYLCSQQPPSPSQTSVMGDLERGGSSTNQQCLSKVHVYWMGLFCFKGMSHVRRMVYVLQERLASRATGYTPKSLNTAVAQLVSHFQPEGPNVTSYLVPLPVVDVALGPREPRRRPTSVRFELEGSQIPDDASSIQGDSCSSWKGASSSAEIVPMP